MAQAGNGSALERLMSAFAQHQWADAIAQCLSPEVAVAGAKACAVSACELHNPTKAREWLARITTTADRNEVLAACEETHVRLEPPHRSLLGPHHRPIRSPAGSGG